jgi:hypothetical protein
LLHLLRSPSGTKLPIRNVRYSVAIGGYSVAVGGKADLRRTVE